MEPKLLQQPPIPARKLEGIYSQEKFNQLKGRLANLQSKVSAKDEEEIFTHIFRFDTYLKNKYNQAHNGRELARRYAMQHVLFSSTITRDMEITQSDFPGKDSVENFITTLEEYYLKGKKGTLDFPWEKKLK